MKVLIPGGSGHIGIALARAMHADGHAVTVLSRRQLTAPWQVALWDGVSLGAWQQHVDDADVVINLAGRSVDCRYTRANRQQILNSRVESTRVVGQAIAASVRPPRMWLQASTATIYAHRFDAANDDLSGIIGGGEPNAPDTWRFSIEVAKAWEATLAEAVTPHTRKVAMRSAMTMGRGRGSVFDTLLKLVRFGLGGNAGNGRQYVSWIHEQDFIRSVYWLISHTDITGAVNLAAPSPLPYSEFMAALRDAAGARLALPAPRALLEIGTFLLRTESELVLKSRRVVPRRLLDSGFSFEFPRWPEAARQLIGGR